MAKENKEKKDDKIKELEEKLRLYEIENNYLKEELKKKEKLIKLKENIKNLDKKIVLVFDPYETYTQLLKTEDPLIVESIVDRLHELKKEMDKKWIRELEAMIKSIMPKVAILAMLLAVALVFGGMLLKLFLQKPQVVTNERIIVMSEEQYQQYLINNKFLPNTTKVQINKENQNNINPNNNNNFIPIETIQGNQTR